MYLCFFAGGNEDSGDDGEDLWNVGESGIQVNSRK